MRMALLTAQRTGDEIMADANKRKEDLMNEVEAERQKMISDMKHRLADEEERLVAAKKETAKFVEYSQVIINKHSEFLSKVAAATQAPVSAVSKPKPPPPEPIPPTREELIMQSAVEIDDAMEKMASSYEDASQPDEEPDQPEASPAPVYDDEGEPTKHYNIPEREDALTPRPKFDFDDLKFGKNFDLEN